MSVRHHFHIDHAGHSISVELYSGLSTEIEVIVDGNVVAHSRFHGTGERTLLAEYPDRRPVPFHVHVVRPLVGAPTCVMRVDEAEFPMPEHSRAF